MRDWKGRALFHLRPQQQRERRTRDTQDAGGDEGGFPMD
jgi:hypothetical protein